jgi:hypothetical protein
VVNELIKNNLYITSNDFADIADVNYSERRSQFKVNNLDRKIVEISNDPNFLCLTTNLINFKVFDNSVIFCNTNQVDNLFYHIKKLDNLKNITLITHQTDQMIDKSFYQKKPESIINWYSVNVDYKSDYLHSIPIGLASDFSLKNLTKENFDDFSIENFKKDNSKIYLNFNINTNFKERNGIQEFFKNKEFATLDLVEPNKNKYLKNIKRFGFVLCPWGNGIDTHRFWETLYAGSIPVTKWHQTYKSAENLPVLFVDNYEDITEDLLRNYMDGLTLQNYNFEVLTKDYWVKRIKSDSLKGLEYHIKENDFETLMFKYKKNIVKIFKSKMKNITTFKNRFTKKFLI